MQAKQLIQSVFSMVGLRVVPLNQTKPIDIRKSSNDPRALLYVGKKQPILINAPISSGRALPLFPFRAKGPHPFVLAASEALNSDDKIGVIRSVLSQYFEMVAPRSAAELLGLQPGEVPLLDREPSWAAVLPWDDETIEQWREHNQVSVKLENHSIGAPLTIAEGWAWCGPVTKGKLNIEIERLYSLIMSIQSNGLRRHDGTSGDMIGTVLVDDNGEWRWQARTGQHRMSVCCAIGYSTIPLRVIKIVNRADVDIWPNVFNGVFTRNVALNIFDCIFDENMPRVTQKWVHYLKTRNWKDL